MSKLVTREAIGCYDACLMEGGQLIRVEADMLNWKEFTDGYVTEALAPGSVYYDFTTEENSEG